MTGKSFELVVKELLEIELSKTFKEPVIIEHRKKLCTSDGTVYEIDLFFKTHISGFEYWNIVECKYWNQFVTRDTINTVLHKATELGVHKAIVVSKKGFQRGALELAQKYRVALIKATDDRSLEYISNFDGNLEGYLNYLSKETDDDLTDKPKMIGLSSPSKDIYEFIAERCGKDISWFLKSGDIENYLDVWDKELPSAIKEQLKTMTPDLIKEYQKIETCGLPLKLMNEPELRIVNVQIFMLKTL